jgi:hypothetical protein
MIEPTFPLPADLALEWSRRTARRVVWIFAAANLGVPLGLFAFAAAIGEDYWWFFWGEGNVMTWFSSVQLVAVAAMAYANHELVRAMRGRIGAVRAGNAWIWATFAAGFVFLAVDEAFEVHEMVRDEVLIPKGMFSGIPLVRPGDIGMYAYLLAGVAAAAFLLSELRRRRSAVIAFGAAVALIAATTFVDSLPRDIEESISPFWTSAFEEIGEIWAQLLFLVAFWLVLDLRLAAAPAAGVTPSPSAGAASP